MPSLNSEQALRFSRRLAIGFGVFLAIIEIFYNWENPSWWPFILVDYLAVALLLVGAFRSNVVLVAGWGFTCAMFYMSFFVGIELEQDAFVVSAKGVLFAITIAGLLLALRGLRHDAT